MTDLKSSWLYGESVYPADVNAIASAVNTHRKTNDRRILRTKEALGRPLERLIYPVADAPALSFSSGPTNSQILGSAILSGATFNGIDVIAGGQVSLFGACNPQHVGAFPGTITYKNICKVKDSLGTNEIYAYTLQFYSDSDKVELIWGNTGPGSYRVWVDDQAVGSLTPTTFASTGVLESLMITFSTAKMRRYRVDLNSANLVGMFVNSSSTPKKYNIIAAEQRGPTVFFFGDSMLGGSTMSTSYNAQIPQYISDLFGWDHAFNFAQGGTGYNVKNAPAGFDNSALPQVRFAAPSSASPSTTVPGSAMPTPDVVFIAYGHNDVAPWDATTQAAALNTVTAARTQWPDAFIVLAGPISGGLAGTYYNSSETALFAATTSYVDGQISSLQGTNRPWLTGSGYAGATTGSGNGDIYIGSDSVHPNDGCIAYMSERFAAELRRLMV